MERLADTLNGVALRAFRAWRCSATVPEELKAALRAQGWKLSDSVGGAYFALLDDDAAGIPSDLPLNCPSLLLSPGQEPLSLPQDFRLWCAWALDAAGTLCAVSGAPAVCLLSLLLPAGYAPAQHARELALDGQAGAAIELLDNLPDELLRDDNERGAVSAERILCLLAWDKASGEEGRLNRFARALHEFNRAAAWLPEDPLAFQCMAAFWERIGRVDMRLRLVNTFMVAQDKPRQDVPAAPEVSSAAVPAWDSETYRPRILFILPEGPDYGADVLFDGLCALLGDDHVVEYPWKPTLHGEDAARAKGYPCVFQRAGAPRGLEETAAQLRAGAFDAVLYADTLGALPAESIALLAGAGRALPWFVVDAWDQPGDYRAVIVPRLDGVKPAAWFKREKLPGARLGDTAYALPFAYPRQFAPAAPAWEGRRGVFWAGNALCGARRAILHRLEQRFGLDLGACFTQEAYQGQLGAASIGLSLFGNGFDTVRYWELPAHGLMLLAERPPIEIPDNFIDGESAVFFDDLGDLEEKLAYYLAHPDEAREIARAGHALYLARHTAEARAARMLGIMQPR